MLWVGTPVRGTRRPIRRTVVLGFLARVAEREGRVVQAQAGKLALEVVLFVCAVPVASIEPIEGAAFRRNRAWLVGSPDRPFDPPFDTPHESRGAVDQAHRHAQVGARGPSHAAQAIHRGADTLAA